MDDLNRLRQLKALADEGLLSGAEFGEKKMAIIQRMLSNASEVANELQQSKAVKAKQNLQGVGDAGPPVPTATKVLVHREPLLSRVSQNARKVKF